MLLYALCEYECLYVGLFYIETYDMSHSGHIVYESNTKTEGKKMANPQKEVHERLTRPHSPSVSKFATHARLPNNNENQKKLRRLLRTKHHIPTTRNTRKERPRNQRMEHENRKTKKNLQTHNQRTDDSELHRKLVKPVVPENRNKQCTSNEH